MTKIIEQSKWVGGLSHWTDENERILYISVAFTWKLDKAYELAVFYRTQGYRVIAGGPGIFLYQVKHLIEDVAEVPAKDEGAGYFPDAVFRHNPAATFASKGCPQKCWFCIVPKMEGNEFTLYPDFPVRPVLCDNNLSALPIEYQRHIISRYLAENVPLLDANSGFEPQTFTPQIYKLWKPINRGPWRFAYDELGERGPVRMVLKMLEEEPGKKKRVYVLIGNEPFADCMQRIEEVIAWGGEPHVQPYIKLNSLERTPAIRHDWTVQKLRDVARWANGHVWRKVPFAEYDRTIKGTAVETYDEQQGLFL